MEIKIETGGLRLDKALSDLTELSNWITAPYSVSVKTHHPSRSFDFSNTYFFIIKNRAGLPLRTDSLL